MPATKLSAPSASSRRPACPRFASIYGHRVSEIDEMFEARKMIGICPQLDIHFDVLTVQKVLLDLDMQTIKDNQAKKLSGGQKRKLSLGIAVLGNPKILLLDEPTAGMDPCSRHIVWNLLKYRKANRVTVFSTHFMDEADILAESLSSLVKQHIPGATLLQQNDQQLVYSLPFKDMDKFSGLFSALDSQSNLGIISYGVSMTTLEDVFLKLEVEAEIDQAGKNRTNKTFQTMNQTDDYSVFTQQPLEEEMDSKSFDEMEQSLLILSETKASLVQNDLYFLKPGDKPHKYKTSLLLQNSTDSDISDLISFFTSQNIMVTMFNDSDYVSVAPHSAALNVMHSEKDYVFAAVFNSTMVYSLPILVNIISNYYLYHLNMTETIQIWSTPFFQEITDIVFKIELYFQAALLGIIVTAMPPYFAMENAENHKAHSDLVQSLAVQSRLLSHTAEIISYFSNKNSYLLHCLEWLQLPRTEDRSSLLRGLRGQLVAAPTKKENKNKNKNINNLAYMINHFIIISTSSSFVFLICLQKIIIKSKNRKFPEPPNNEDEDEDVKAERLKVKELMSCQCCEEKPSIIISNLHKEYDDKKDFLLSRKVKKIFLGDYSSETSEEDDSIKCMGYCPQINPLWPDTTLQEHFEIYGAIKGMSASDMKEVITRITNALDLKEHLRKTVKKLPAGIKRKLCFALSMLGNPQITLLDEPSTGMDPKAKQHMWRAIRTAFKNKKRAAILTTHYMEEAEAVCDRVAIMVSGQLRCIGTVQHLKSKYGKGYFLEIKLKDWVENLEVDRLQREIKYIFPNASRQERELPRHGAGKIAVLVETAMLAKTAALATHGAPWSGNLLVCEQ
ncbi:ATP-binding cassette sub- A member 5 [Saguinus oedipus]|uniref:ATP-binding cassette sub- A member 5 n=1 Tax=Saguinus oedipus TaxID=9490 RepID=A0ABQ9VRF5_SAGOE|nr:ATP-binding cassette sub- A member 5 [Saguinus oedipus]